MSNRHDNIKQLCIDHIYNAIDISRFKYELLKTESGLQQLLEEKF